VTSISLWRWDPSEPEEAGDLLRVERFLCPELFTRAPYRPPKCNVGPPPIFLFTLPQTMNLDIPCHCGDIVGSMSTRLLIPEFYNSF
jgi:hypothetical protein